MSRIAPLTEVKGVGKFHVGTDDKNHLIRTACYAVICRECGDVTREESGFTVNEAPLITAGLYRQRHLAKHLAALSAEMTEASR